MSTPTRVSASCNLQSGSSLRIPDQWCSNRDAGQEQNEARAFRASLHLDCRLGTLHSVCACQLTRNSKISVSIRDRPSLLLTSIICPHAMVRITMYCRTTARSVTTTHANLEAHSYRQGSAAQCVVKTKHFRANALLVLVMRRGACPGLGPSEYSPSAKRWLERFHANATCA